MFFLFVNVPRCMFVCFLLRASQDRDIGLLGLTLLVNQCLFILWTQWLANLFPLQILGNVVDHAHTKLEVWGTRQIYMYCPGSLLEALWRHQLNKMNQVRTFLWFLQIKGERQTVTFVTLWSNKHKKSWFEIGILSSCLFSRAIEMTSGVFKNVSPVNNVQIFLFCL